MSPSLASKLGALLNNMALFFKAEALIRDDHTSVSKYQSFIQVSNARWTAYVSGPSKKELMDKKCNNPQLVPFTEYVKKLTDFLGKKLREDVKNLEEQSSPENYQELAARGESTKLWNSKEGNLRPCDHEGWRKRRCESEERGSR